MVSAALIERWERILRGLAQAPGNTDRCDNAVRVIRAAVQSYAPLAKRRVEVYAKGSFVNGTNAKVDSDVAISICYRGASYSRYTSGLNANVVGLVDHQYTYANLRSDRSGRDADDPRDHVDRIADRSVATCWGPFLIGHNGDSMKHVASLVAEAPAREQDGAQRG